MYARSAKNNQPQSAVSGTINKVDPLLGQLLERARKS
jgi:hypothetical protein